MSHPQLWSPAHRATFAAIALAALVFVPYLGSVGLWDPWETHYAEVAREMLERRDPVHPHWERAYFFSKPALTLWCSALGMLAATQDATLTLLLTLGGLGLAGWRLTRTRSLSAALVTMLFAGLLAITLWGRASRVEWKLGGLLAGDGALPLSTEWGVRLPFTLASIAAVGSLTWALSRTVNARVGFAAGFVFTTMPLTFLLSRQAVTDPLLVSATVCGVSCALVALFDGASRHRARWWYGAWASFALATLAKGWLGFLVPSAVFAGYLALFVARRSLLGQELAWLARTLSRPLSWGVFAGLGVGLLAARLGGAWGTTFLSTPPLGAAHWLGLTWGALALWLVTTVLAGRQPSQPAPPVASALTEARVGRGVLLFLFIALPWYYAMFTFPGRDDEGKLFWVRFIVHDHLARFFTGVFTTTPGGSFTYFLEQGGYAIFPWVALVPGALAVAAKVRVRQGTPRDAVAGIAALWLIVSWLSVGDSATKFHHYVFPLLPPLAVLIALFLDELWTEGLERHLVALALGVPLFALVGKDLWSTPKHFTDLFVFNYERPWPEFLVTRPALGSASVKALLKWGFLGALGVNVAWTALRRRAAVAATTFAGALAFALWFSWSHWVDLSHHWTQRDLFWRYATLRRPGEPIGAFLMNWRGETFYSRNEVVQIPAQDTAQVVAALLARSRRVWFLVEHARLPALVNAVGGRRVEQVEPSLNNKFVLVSVESRGP